MVKEPEDLEDTRYKIVFSSDPKIFIIGDQTHKLIKSSIFLSNGYTLPAGSAFYSESSGNFHIRNSSQNILYKGNVASVLSNEGDRYPVETIKIEVPENERIIRAYVTKDEDIYSLIELDRGSMDNDIYLRKVTGNGTDLVLKFSDILSFYPGHSSMYNDKIEYLQSMDKLIYLGGGYPVNNFRLEINLSSLETKAFPNTSFNRLFGSKEEYFILKLETNGNDETSVVLFDQDGFRKGGIPDGKYTGSSRYNAVFGYDELEMQFEFMQKSDGVSQMGILNTEEFSFDIKAGVPSEIPQNSLLSPFYFYDNNN